MGKWYLINKEDISIEAQDILADIYMIQNYTKAGKKLLGWYTESLLEDLNENESEKCISALEELKDRGYINTKFIKETKRDRKRLVKALTKETGEDFSYLLHTDGNIIGIKFLKLKLKSKIYVYTHMKYESGLEIRPRKKYLTVEHMLRKLSKNGFYIVILATLTLLCELINTAITIWTTFR